MMLFHRNASQICSDEHARQLRTIAKVLTGRKRAVAQCLFDPLVKWAKWEGRVESLGMEQVIQLEVAPAVDFLINYLRTGDSIWRSLYLGHVLEQMHRPGDDAESAQAHRSLVFSQQREALLRLLDPFVKTECLESFDRHIRAMNEIVTNPQVQDQVRVLFVGDCLMEHIVEFLTIPLLKHKLALHYEIAASKNPIELRNSLRDMARRKFDLVCYSPYSIAFSPILSETFYNPNPMQRSRKVRKLAADAHQQTRSTLLLLTELFECNVYVQNTNNIRSHTNRLFSIFKNILTRRPRTIAANEVNSLLDRSLSEMRQHLNRPIAVVDEVSLKERYGELTLGRVYYADDKHHPSVLAQKLSAIYCNLILANKPFLSKKVVVIDLDDTVWKGTIGEGSVDHYTDRQKVLHELKAKGVLLAIASQNDPKNVHWTGGVLHAQDFVAQQINWDPKPTCIRRIASELNLKLKDFVFIDDRPDQRALVESSIPEIHVLDATVDSTWDMLRWWTALLPDQTETDRTQLYIERKQRESFLNIDTDLPDENTLFAALDLKIQLRAASGKELPRVVELINRTNQFNTSGSRTSLAQVTALNDSSQHLILVTRARDKFGEMGIVSAMIILFEEDALVVTSWVLSCRVFGFGIEAAMLNFLRRLAQRLNLPAIHGRIVETLNNHPCREVYAKNGFVRQGLIWTSETTVRSPDPPWLEIKAADDIGPLVHSRWSGPRAD